MPLFPGMQKMALGLKHILFCHKSWMCGDPASVYFGRCWIVNAVLQAVRWGVDDADCTAASSPRPGTHMKQNYEVKIKWEKIAKLTHDYFSCCLKAPTWVWFFDSQNPLQCNLPQKSATRMFCLCFNSSSKVIGEWAWVQSSSIHGYMSPRRMSVANLIIILISIDPCDGQRGRQPYHRLITS